jgi:preprotein translocase subunit SecE
MTKIIEFVKEVRIEMAHVTWPTKSETAWLTVLVIVISFAVAYFLGFFDYLFSLGLGKLLLK